MIRRKLHVLEFSYDYFDLSSKAKEIRRTDTIFSHTHKNHLVKNHIKNSYRNNNEVIILWNNAIWKQLSAILNCPF